MNFYVLAKCRFVFWLLVVIFSKWIPKWEKGSRFINEGTLCLGLYCNLLQYNSTSAINTRSNCQHGCITHVAWSLKYLVHKNPWLVPVLWHMHSVHSLTYFFKSHFNTLPSTFRYDLRIFRHEVCMRFFLSALVIQDLSILTSLFSCYSKYTSYAVTRGLYSWRWA